MPSIKRSRLFKVFLHGDFTANRSALGGVINAGGRAFGDNLIGYRIDGQRTADLIGLTSGAAGLARSAFRTNPLVAVESVPQVTANRIAGNALRDEIAAALSAEGRGVQTEVYKPTLFGKRYIDIEVRDVPGGNVLGGIETKLGNSPYTPAQRSKDFLPETLRKLSGECCARAAIMTSSLDLIFIKVIAVTAQRISQFGFKKSGNAFRLISGGNAAIVEFQKSRDNTRERHSFTVNVAIVCGHLLDQERIRIQKSRVVEGHLRDRIGTFLPNRQDKLWEISCATDGDALAKDVSDLICDLAVPYLLQYIDSSALVALWESGQAPGLTESARIRKLETLKSILEASGA